MQYQFIELHRITLIAITVHDSIGLTRHSQSVLPTLQCNRKAAPPTEKKVSRLQVLSLPIKQQTSELCRIVRYRVPEALNLAMRWRD